MNQVTTAPLHEVQVYVVNEAVRSAGIQRSIDNGEFKNVGTEFVFLAGTGKSEHFINALIVEKGFSTCDEIAHYLLHSNFSKDVEGESVALVPGNTVALLMRKQMMAFHVIVGQNGEHVVKYMHNDGKNVVIKIMSHDMSAVLMPSQVAASWAEILPNDILHLCDLFGLKMADNEVDLIPPVF